MIFVSENNINIKVICSSIVGFNSLCLFERYERKKWLPLSSVAIVVKQVEINSTNERSHMVASTRKIIIIERNHSTDMMIR